MILLVEDEMIIAFDLCDRLEDSGYEVDGPYPSVKRALGALEGKCPKAAILDVQLVDGDVLPVADKLVEMNVPIVFHSGHARPETLRKRYPHATICSKPCAVGQIESELREILVDNA